MSNPTIRKYSTGTTEYFNAGSYFRDIGKPTDTSASYTLKSLVDGLASGYYGFSLVASASINSYPASLMAKFPPTVIQNGSGTLFPLTSIFTPSRIQWEGDTSYLQALSASYKDSSFPIFPSTTRYSNKYFGVGNQLLRYDGHALSHACVNNLPSLVATASAGGGTLDTGSYMAMVTFVTQDANGTRYESAPAYSNVVGVPAGSFIKYTIPKNSYRPSWAQNYDSWGAFVNGNQTVAPSSGSITIDAFGENSSVAPKVLVGDTVYVPCTIGGIWTVITAPVTAVTSTTIKFTCASTITVYSGYPIGVNGFINFYRSKVGPSQLFYRSLLPAGIINSDYPAHIESYQFGDNIADSLLGTEYTFPTIAGTPLPNVAEAIRALATYRGSLLVAYRSRVYFSDSVQLEAFPVEFYYDPNPQDKSPITGFAPRADHHLVFKENSISIVSGELVTGQFVVDTLTDSVGCIAPNSIVQIDSDEGSFHYWLDKNGVYRQTGSNSPQLVSDIEGSSIQAIFDKIGTQRVSYATVDGENQYRLATAYHDTELRLYVLCLPVGIENTGYPTAYRTFAFNYKKNEWYEWANYSFGRGAVVDTNRGVFTAERNVLNGSVRAYIQKRLSLGGGYDYSDDEKGIGWSYKSGFDSLGEPGVKKSVIRMRAESLDVNYPGDASTNTTSFSLVMAISQPNHENSSIAGKTIIPTTAPSATLKAKKGTWLSHAFTLSGTALEEKPVITGVQMEYSADYKPIIKEKSNG